MTRPLLAPLEWAYAAVVRSRNARFDRMPPQRLRWPVVSVGNLSVGGAGKTPLVISLARLLERNGWAPDVLSRGYGRSGQAVVRVDPAGDAGQFGDEPLLIAKAAAAPVYVGASRYQAGLLAEREGAADARHVHLLDDGFQHRQLARTMDIVVIHRSDLRERLLPAGRLREPLSSLVRADVIVLRQEDAELEAALRVHAKKECHFWRVRRTLTLTGSIQRALVFCAIARPEEFFRAVTAAGAGILERMRFRDHHRYTEADMDRVAHLGRRLGCDAFVITAKDGVKLNAAMRQRLIAVAPLHTATLTAQIDDEDTALAQLSSQLSSRLRM